MEYGRPPLKPLAARFLHHKASSKKDKEEENRTSKEEDMQIITHTIFVHLEEAGKVTGSPYCCCLCHCNIHKDDDIQEFNINPINKKQGKAIYLTNWSQILDYLAGTPMNLRAQDLTSY